MLPWEVRPNVIHFVHNLSTEHDFECGKLFLILTTPNISSHNRFHLFALTF